MLRSRARTRGRFPAVESEYSVLGKTPGLIADFKNEFYRPNAGANRFSDLITHSRTSNATMTDSDGLIKWAPHNLLTYSEEFDNAAWGVQLNATITDLDDGVSRLQLTVGVDAYYGQVYANGTATYQTTFAVQVKSNTGVDEVLRIRLYDGRTLTYADVTATQEWQTFTVTANQANAGNANVLFRNTSSLDGADVLIRFPRAYRSDLGGMVDNPDRGDSYVPTTSSAVYLPRRGHHVYNGYEWVNEGVLAESESRSNEWIYSVSVDDWSKVSATTTNNYAISPDGTQNAGRILYSGTTTTWDIAYLGTFTGSYTWSAWLKTEDGSEKTVYISWGSPDPSRVIPITINGEWKRYSAQVSPNGVNVHLGNHNTITPAGWSSFAIHIYGAQLEQASTPSSYIPTSGSSVTRAAETFTIPAANLPWPTPQYIGDELVTNGTFDTDSDWTLSNSTTISGGLLNLDRDGGGTVQASQELPSLVIGSVYVVSYDILSISNGINVRVRSGGTTQSVSAHSATGSYEQVFTFVGGGLTELIDIEATLSLTATGTVDNISVREINPLSVSIQMDGRMTYADDNLAVQVDLLQWNKNDGLNYILQRLRTTDARVGEVRFFQANDGTVDTVNSDSDAYSPDILVPYNIASRHGSTFINGAVSGTALTADTTPIALPDLSSTDLSLGYDYMGTLKTFRMWNRDIGDDGIEVAST